MELDVARKAATKAAYDAEKRNGETMYVPMKKEKMYRTRLLSPNGPMDSLVRRTKRERRKPVLSLTLYMPQDSMMGLT